MKPFLFLVLALHTFAADVPVTVKWDANPEPDVSGYWLYVKPFAAPTYGAPIELQATEKTVLLPEGEFFTAKVIAVNTSGMFSPASAELIFRAIKPGENRAATAPVSLYAFSPLKLTIEQSSDLLTWTPLSVQYLEPSEAARFFRLCLTSF